MENVMNMVQNENQLMQAESVYSLAVKRISNEFPSVSEDSYRDKLFAQIVRTVVNDGYSAAVDYAKTAFFAM